MQYGAVKHDDAAQTLETSACGLSAELTGVAPSRRRHKLRADVRGSTTDCFRPAGGCTSVCRRTCLDQHTFCSKENLQEASVTLCANITIFVGHALASARVCSVPAVRKCNASKASAKYSGRACLKLFKAFLLMVAWVGSRSTESRFSNRQWPCYMCDSFGLLIDANMGLEF